MPIQIMTGDLLETDAEYIVQQCSTTVNRCMGLAAAINKKFKVSFYNKPRTPGTIMIKDRIIGMMAQINGGKPKAPETTTTRELLFLQCLDQLPKAKTIAFPFGIGCGLAGGNWDHYFKLIKNWSHNNPDTMVYIYKLN